MAHGNDIITDLINAGINHLLAYSNTARIRSGGEYGIINHITTSRIDAIRALVGDGGSGLRPFISGIIDSSLFYEFHELAVGTTIGTMIGGRCGEISSMVMYGMLLHANRLEQSRAIPPMIERVHITGGTSDHSFIVIGRQTGSSLKSPDTWGTDARIIDPTILDTRFTYSSASLENWLTKLGEELLTPELSRAEVGSLDMDPYDLAASHLVYPAKLWMQGQRMKDYKGEKLTFELKESYSPGASHQLIQLQRAIQDARTVMLNAYQDGGAARPRDEFGLINAMIKAEGLTRDNINPSAVTHSTISIFSSAAARAALKEKLSGEIINLSDIETAVMEANSVREKLKIFSHAITTLKERSISETLFGWLFFSEESTCPKSNTIRAHVVDMLDSSWRDFLDANLGHLSPHVAEALSADHPQDKNSFFGFKPTASELVVPEITAEPKPDDTYTP